MSSEQKPRKQRGKADRSARNLKYMRRFAEVWPAREIVQAVLAQLTWYHNIALLEKLPDADQRLWYARQTLQHGSSRNWACT